MATESRPVAKYEVHRVKTSKAKILGQSRALNETFQEAPTGEDLQARQNAIGGTRRTVAVPSAKSKKESADGAVSDEPTSDEPEADLAD